MIHTQEHAAQRLLLACIADAVQRDDVHFLLSDVAAAYLALIGANERTRFEFLQRFLRGQLGDAFDARRLEQYRYQVRPEDAVQWQSWPVLAR
mgnify:CR=1 FL=1